MPRPHKYKEPRNGTDALSMAFALVACLLLVIALITGDPARSILWLLALVVLIISYFRIFSHNLAKRQAENDRFLQLIRPLTTFFARQKTKRRQKNLYCFFKCPNCSTVLRVPKGKGRIRITCKSCQHVFERRS